MYDVKQVDPGGVVVAAVGRGAGRQARLRQGPDGPRRGEPEGAAGRVPGRAARDPRRGPQAARSTSCWSPRARRRSARRTSAQVVRRPEVARRPEALHAASSCRRRRRTRTARSPCRSAPRASSSWSWWRAARSGGAARRRTSTRATARASTARPSIWCRRWPRWSPPTAIRPSTASPTPSARPRPPRRRCSTRRRRASSEATAKRLLSADRWAHDLPWRASLERFLFTPTVNIEGLVAGYTGPGGKTVLPHRAVAKLDLRLVPDMTFDGAVAALKAHLAKRGFGDIEVNPSGGYDPTSTSADAPLIRAADRGLPARRPRSDPLAAQRRLLSRLRVHRRAAQAAGGPLRPRPRQRRPRARTSTT